MGKIMKVQELTSFLRYLSGVWLEQLTKIFFIFVSNTILLKYQIPVCLLTPLLSIVEVKKKY